MTRRATRIFLEVLAGLLGLVLLVSAFAAWRLSQGPVELDFLAPRIEEALESAEDGLEVRIGKTELLWAGWNRKLDLRAENLWVRNAEQITIARFPELEFELSLSALLNGIFVPSDVTVKGVSLRFVRLADGSIHLRGTQPAVDAEQETAAGEDAAGGADLTRALPRVVDDIISAPDPKRPLSYLERFRVVGGKVSVDDQRLDRLWIAPWSDITLRSDGGVLAGNAILQVEFVEDLATLFARLEYDPLRGEVEIKVDLGGIPIGPIVEDLQKKSRTPGTDAADVRDDAETAVPETAVPETAVPETAVPEAADPETAVSETAEQPASDSAQPSVSQGGATPALSLDLSLFGSIDLLLTLEGHLREGRFDLSSNVGRLTLPGVLPQELSIRNLSLRGELNRPARRLILEEGSLSLYRDKVPGPRLNFSVEVSGQEEENALPPQDFLEGALAVSGSAVAKDLALSEFAYYWPEALAPGAQRWVVKNIPAGLTKTAQANFKLALSSEKPRTVVLEDLFGQLAYEDMEIHYLRPLPPITGVTGSAEIDERGMTFRAEGGQVEGGLTLSQSHVVISGFDEGHEHLTVESRIAGPLQAALAIIDHERLDLLSGLGLDPADTAGEAEGALRFAFPLISGLSFADVDLGVQAQVSDAAAAKLVLGQDLSEGTLVLDVDRESMTLEGQGILGGVPVEDVKWREIFSASDPLDREISTHIPEMTVEQLGAFGLDLHDFLANSFSGDLTYRSETNGRSEVAVMADVTATAIALDPLPWVKPAGESGRAKVRVGFLDDRPDRLLELDVESESLALSATGDFDPNGGGFKRLQAPVVSSGRNRLEGVTLVWNGPDLEISGEAGTFDMGQFLVAAEEAPEEDEKPEEPQERGRLHIMAPQLERVYFAEDRYFDDLSVELLRGDRGWEVAEIHATIPKAFATPPEKNLSLDPDAPVTRSVSVNFHHNLAEPDDLTVLTHDTGGMLRALGWFDTISGGRLVVTGDSDAPLPQGPLRMGIEIQTFAAEDVPALARLFTLASLTGPSDLLGGQGLSFERLVGNVNLADNLLKTDLIRAYGSNVGLTAAGIADLDALHVDLQGTLIPAYTINRFIEQIPLIGTLLTGGEGEGVIAMTYSMRGDLTDPEISVNPLSALAPGFLRGLFQDTAPGEVAENDTGAGGDGSEERNDSDIPRALPQRDK